MRQPDKDPGPIELEALPDIRLFLLIIGGAAALAFAVLIGAFVGILVGLGA